MDYKRVFAFYSGRRRGRRSCKNALASTVDGAADALVAESIFEEHDDAIYLVITPLSTTGQGPMPAIRVNFFLDIRNIMRVHGTVYGGCSPGFWLSHLRPLTGLHRGMSWLRGCSIVSQI